MMAEKLPSHLLERSSKKSGLVAIKVSVNSPPQYEIEPVEGSPTEYLKKLSQHEGITQDRLNAGLKVAFGNGE